MDLHSPVLRAASLLWQPHPGAWSLTVVCKATYTLMPGTSPLAEEQEPPNDDDTHWNDDPARSLSAVTDLVPFKPRAEVLLVGHAFAPGKVPARSVVARLAVGAVDKSIEVFCDRWWTAVGAVREGARFTRAALRYERAAGGPGTENPVGMRPDGPSDRNGLVPLPNLQPAGLAVASRGVVIPPVGFGPISPTWPGRAEKLGAQGAVWSRGGWLGDRLPRGIDAAYFNAAPLDQQLDELDGGVAILLENLHPEYPIFGTCLPGVRPRVVVERPGVHAEELAMQCDTLWIDTGRSICTLTWRGLLDETRPDEEGDIVVSLVEPEEPPTGDAWVSKTAPLAAQAATQPPREEAGGTVFWLDGPPVPAPSPSQVPPQDEVGGTMFLAPPVERPLVLDLDEPIRSDIAPPALVPRVEVGPVTAVLDAPMLSAMAAPKPAALPLPPPSAPSAPMRKELRDTAVLGQTPSAPAIPFPPARGSAPAPPPLVALPSLLAGDVDLGPKGSIGEMMAAGAQGPRFPGDVPLGPNARMGSLADIMGAGVQGLADAPMPEAPREPLPRPAPKPRIAVPEPIELLWFDAAYTKRIREHPEWQVLLMELENRDLDRRMERALSSGSPETDERPDRWTDQGDVFEVVARGAPLPPVRVKDALEAATGEDGRVDPPLVLVAGKLRLTFDEIESLKAAVAAVRPLLSTADPKLKEAAEAGMEILGSPWPESARTLAERAVLRIRRAFDETRLTLDRTYVDELIERAVLRGRHYQRRTVLGQVWLRALLDAGGSPREALLVYLPESLANELPMFPEMKARIVAEVRGQQDKYEDQAVALRAVVVAKVG